MQNIAAREAEALKHEYHRRFFDDNLLFSRGSDKRKDKLLRMNHITGMQVFHALIPKAIHEWGELPYQHFAQNLRSAITGVRVAKTDYEPIVKANQDEKYDGRALYIAHIAKHSPNPLARAIRDGVITVDHFPKWLALGQEHLQLPQKAAKEFKLVPHFGLDSKPNGKYIGHYEAPMTLDIYDKKGKRVAGAGFLLYDQGEPGKPKIAMRITNVQGEKGAKNHPRFSGHVGQDWRPFLITKLAEYAKENKWEVEGATPYAGMAQTREGAEYERQDAAITAAFEAAGFKLEADGTYRKAGKR